MIRPHRVATETTTSASQPEITSPTSLSLKRPAVLIQSVAQHGPKRSPGDIDGRLGELAVRGKGNRHDRLPLPVDVGEAIVAWLQRGRHRCEATEVFVRVGAPQRGLSSEGISAVVWHACERAGMPPIGAHRLRHTAATQFDAPSRHST
jgi:integrase